MNDSISGFRPILEKLHGARILVAAAALATVFFEPESDGWGYKNAGRAIPWKTYVADYYDSQSHATIYVPVVLWWWVYGVLALLCWGWLKGKRVPFERVLILSLPCLVLFSPGLDLAWRNAMLHLFCPDGWDQQQGIMLREMSGKVLLALTIFLAAPVVFGVSGGKEGK